MAQWKHIVCWQLKIKQCMDIDSNMNLGFPQKLEAKFSAHITKFIYVHKNIVPNSIHD